MRVLAPSEETGDQTVAVTPAHPRNVALSALPLSSAFRVRLELSLQTRLTYVTLAELRRLGPLQLVRALRSLRADACLLAFEDANSSAFLPYLLLLASLSRARSIEAVDPELGIEALRRRQVPLSLCRIVAACALGQLAVRRARKELTHLARVPRAPVPPIDLQRVLYLKTNMPFGLPAGGSIAHTAGIVNAFLRRGLEVDFLSMHPPVMIDGRARTGQVPPPAVCAIPAEANLYLSHADTLRQARSILASHDGAFIYARMMSGPYPAVVLSHQMGLPLAVEYNGSEIWAAEHWGQRPPRYREVALLSEEVCLKHAHLVVTVSEVLREELLARGVEPERIVCHPNGIDPAIFDPARFTSEDRQGLRRRHGIPPEATVVTFIGTFGKWHGVDVLAEVIRGLIDQEREWLHRHRVHFLLVGDGQLMPRVRAILAGDEVNPFVTLTGLVPQDQAPRYLAASDVVVASHVGNPDGSRFFGSPTKLFEYMAMGKGIVASDLEQIGQVLRHSLRVEDLPEGPAGSQVSELAVLTPPGDRAGLRRGIRFLVEQPNWRQQLGENARREVLAHYTWDHHVSAILERLTAVMGGGFPMNGHGATDG